MHRTASLIVLCFGVLAPVATSQAETIALVGARLIDGVTDHAIEPAVVIVEDEVIKVVKDLAP